MKTETNKQSKKSKPHLPISLTQAQVKVCLGFYPSLKRDWNMSGLRIYNTPMT